MGRRAGHYPHPSGGCSGGLAAGYGHVAGRAGFARFADGEIVAQRFDAHSLIQRRVQRCNRRLAAHCAAQVDPVIMAKAGVKLPGRGHADAVAAIAEIAR